MKSFKRLMVFVILPIIFSCFIFVGCANEDLPGDSDQVEHVVEDIDDDADFPYNDDLAPSEDEILEDTDGEMPGNDQDEEGDMGSQNDQTAGDDNSDSSINDEDGFDQPAEGDEDDIGGSQGNDTEADPDTEEGDGDSDLPHSNPATIQIQNYSDLTSLTLENLKNVKIELLNNIDCNFEEIFPLGDYTTPFEGEFDGNGFTISNFVLTSANWVNNGSNKVLGVFGVVQNAKIHDVNFTQIVVDEYDASSCSVGLIGHNLGHLELENVRISNSSFNLVGGDIKFGGFIGQDTMNTFDIRRNLSFVNNIVTIECYDEGLCYGGICGKVINQGGDVENLTITDNFISVFDFSAVANVGYLYGILDADRAIVISDIKIEMNIFDFFIESSTCLNGMMGLISGLEEEDIIINNLQTDIF